MSPSPRSRRRTPYKPPRDRKEVVFAVLTSLVVFLATSALVWFLRPNQDSGTTPAVTSPIPGLPDPNADANATTTVPANAATTTSTP